MVFEVSVCTQLLEKDEPLLFLRNNKKNKITQHKQRQMRTEWDLSAALMCKQFLKDHFLFIFEKRKRKKKEDYIITVEMLDMDVRG